MNKQETEQIIFDIDTSEILGVFNNILHLKTNDNILLVDKKEYLRILNLWIDGKEKYCELHKHYCGVMGYTFAKKYKEEKPIILKEWNEDIEEYENIKYSVFSIEEFEDFLDFEHG